VPRADIKKEFLAADVFVLPTIAEGSALVTYEALACGLPVITTPNCGSVVRDGIDGFIVPVRNVEALADAIERVVSDRTLRATLSANARERAKEFTWARYGERLIDALSSLEPAKAS
jgi:glycosyltransferase involved in cell wall biosynthesis